MGTAHEPEPAALIIGTLVSSDAVRAEAVRRLVERFGPIDLESSLWPFDHTRYYEKEMGAGLQRGFFAFARPVDPGNLVSIKQATNAIEADLAGSDKRRRVNLDPGLLDAAKLILATTKDCGHRVYIGGGIYAEATLHYQDGDWRPWPWTYPDYQSDTCREFFRRVRARHLKAARA